MKAIETNLLTFLHKSPQFAIPIYQRNYSWTSTQCRQLWDDLLRAGRSDDIKAHFIGSVVYVKRGQDNVVVQEPLMVIDGQQRLTTSTLLIAALAKHFEKHCIENLLGAFSAKKLRNNYLINPDEDGDRYYKLILSETDKGTLLAILKNAALPEDASNRIEENYKLFQDLIESHHAELEALCQGLAKLMIVDVSLDRTQDNPQLIFESMNSTGLELSQADLIRNYILMGLVPKLQKELYISYWRPMEKAFGQTGYGVHFDPFMRHYLTAKTGEIPNLREVYSAFKGFAPRFKDDTKSLVADVHAYASYYCAIALGAEIKPKLKQALQDLRELKVDVAYPFLLDVYHDYKQSRLSEDDVIHIVRLVESFVFRRAVCGLPTNSMNKIFASLSRTLKKDRYLESVQATLMLLQSYRRFPSDEEFLKEIKERDLYNIRSRTYWLRRLENHGRKERVVVEDYTIEHILPQNEELSKAWKIELGKAWHRIQQNWLHTLGNLTLTGYNSEYSDRPFAYKRDQVSDKQGNLVGFAHSPLKLNNGLGKVAQWNEDAIKERADRLAKLAVKVWAAPSLASDVLNIYRLNTAKSGKKYDLSAHPHLSTGLVRELFEALRQSIQALDACVTEDFLKLYVAYKAETNFVDIIPQAKRLLLVLNLDISQIEDPKGMCRDISNIGRWGNGDVELIFNNIDDLPYVMGLVRQSFEHQMGDQQNI
jgi:uncharacterized protein with ParB-like and HNH nuclease domain/predicted transport protein